MCLDLDTYGFITEMLKDAGDQLKDTFWNIHDISVCDGFVLKIGYCSMTAINEAVIKSTKHKYIQWHNVFIV